MKFFTKFLLFFFLIFALNANAQHANQKSVPSAVDKRLRTFFYKPDAVYEYTGYYGMPSRIDLDPTEKILTIAMGDTTAWMINPVGFRLFLKPVKFDAQTYMSIITNKRIYYFELYAKELEGLNDPNIVYATKFIYPEGNLEIPNQTGDSEIIQVQDEIEAAEDFPDPVRDANKLNFNYTISGSKVISPLEVFDDGEFTYLKFKPVNGEQPAIFQVMPDGNEALINFRIMKGYTVIEMVGSRFTLRFGGEVACIYNESMPMSEIVPMNGERTGEKFFGLF
ncbi:MAG: TrbG/VirB9 family P-type conjugative transfer protein [Rickettsiales bacterium]|nr:TrbG/VirB9 family P-type conjugative transfer protein [Rickettsiales bacterium]